MLHSRSEIWEEDILITDVEELEAIDEARNKCIKIHVRRLNAKEVLITRRDE